MEKKEKPNLVLILSDQHRFCDVGYQGNPHVETPCLDALAERSAVFESAYSTCPLCVPARGSLLTGLHALRHGAAANDLPIKPSCESIADVFTRVGYDTAYIGKWHLGGAPREAFVPYYNRLGFRYWRANNCNHNYLNGYYDDNNNIRHALEGYAPVGETDLAIEYLQSGRKKQQPFAMVLAYGIPHDPYALLPPGELERYQARNVPFRENFDPILQPGEFLHAPYDPKTNYAGYYAHIGEMDRQIARVIETLKQMGEFENTIFVYTSDHGDMLGSHGLLNKQHYYEESAKVPLLISWPGHIMNGRRKTAIGIVDLAPTLLGLIHEKFSDSVDGQDLSRVALNLQEEFHRYSYFYSYVPCHQAKDRAVESWRAISDGRMVFAADETGEPLAMFDNASDPMQLHNLTGKRETAQLQTELKNRLDKFVGQVDGYLPWVELLQQHNLDAAWNESEAFFDDKFHATYQRINKLRNAGIK